MIKCEICKKEFGQITYSHLKYHDVTLQEYKKTYPDSPIVSEEVGEKISEFFKGKPKTKEHRDNLKIAINATFDNGRIGKSGTTGMKMTDETKQKMSDAHIGKKHTEETKQKIGASQKGKIIPRESVEKQKETARKTIEKQGHGHNKGKTYSVDACKNISEAAKNRDPELVQAKVDAMNNARRGQIESPEVREKKSEARSKYMSENPSKCRETNPEKEFKQYCIDNNISFIQQYRIDGFKHPYDFYLPDIKLIVEIDGPQHWFGAAYGTKGKTEDEKEEIFNKQLIKDAEENYIALTNGCAIARINVRTTIYDSEFGDFLKQLEVQNFKI